MNQVFRKAETKDIPVIWQILQEAIAQRKLDGSLQWQDGYPNEYVVSNDVEKEYGFVIEQDQKIVAYAALIFDGEPAYENIDGEWIMDGKYLTIHRMAVATKWLGNGIAQLIMLKAEETAKAEGIKSIRIDTNYDNGAMLNICNKLGYQYCGEVQYRGGIRKAFQKVL